MRQTDERMAKYSRRGLISNFAAFIVCLIAGSFFSEHRSLAIILTLGLLLLTLLRGFLLFRFDSLYPRAPAKWRNTYFVVTMLGASWWGIIMASVTVVLEMRGVAPLFWLYTIVFFSTTAYAFAPYYRFLSIYQFFGLIPGALAAIYVGHNLSYFYAALLLLFYGMLRHQCGTMSSNYWDRLNAEYTLARKETSLEVAKRDVKATQELSQEFIEQLQKELCEICAEHDGKEFNVQSIQRLSAIVSEFGSLINKTIAVRECIFNIRHELQHVVACAVDKADHKGVELEVVLSSALPMRVRGDSEKTAQILRTLLSLVLEAMDAGTVVVEVDFVRQSGLDGELSVTITGGFPPSRRGFFVDAQVHLEQSLDFYCVKGLANVMNGSLELTQPANTAFEYRLSLPIHLSHIRGQLDFHRGHFNGRRLLLIHPNPKIQDIKRQQLDALGFKVECQSSFKKATQSVIESYRQQPIHAVYYQLSSVDDDASAFQTELLTHVDAQHTHQFVCVSKTYERFLRKNLDDKMRDRIHFVRKPAGLFELELAFSQVMSYDNDSQNGKATKSAQRFQLVFYSRQDGFSQELERKLPKEQFELKQAKKSQNIINMLLDNKQTKVLLLDANSGFDLREITQSIRSAELESQVEAFVPILCVGNNNHQGEDISPIYQAGVDDYLDFSEPTEEFQAMVRRWFSLTTL